MKKVLQRSRKFQYMKKKRKKAIALRYNPGEDHAPKVSAKGQGRIAEKIIELASRYGIPIKDDPALVEVLSKLDLCAEVPPTVYVAVAELLAFVYSLNRKKQG